MPECQSPSYNFIKKEILTQVFSCEFCAISKNTFSYRTPLVAASGYHAVLDSTDADTRENIIMSAKNKVYPLTLDTKVTRGKSI